MKKLLCAFFVVGLVSSCGLGNSAGSFSSAGSSTSAGSGSSAGGSSFFGRRNRTTTTTTTTEVTVDARGRKLVSAIKEARFERTRDGGIIRATAIAPRQGYYNARLVSPTEFKPDENGVLTLEFRATEPRFQTAISTERSREIVVGVFISNQKLAAARSIRVVGSRNQITLRR